MGHLGQRRIRACVWGLLLVVGGCSSSTTGTGDGAGGGGAGGGCADISGNWKVASERTDGTCDPATFGGSESTLTVRKADDGSWVVVMPGLEGGCPGELDAASCKFIANCDLTANGQVVGSGGIEWTFAGKSFTGSEIVRALPPLVDPSCTANYADTGSKL